MRWKKGGLIYAPTGESWWAKSGAQLPTATMIDAQTIRVYFACKDREGYGRISFVDVQGDNPQRILRVAEAPVLDLGDLGTFDDCGVVPNYLLQTRGKQYLYYQGFQRTERVPYLTFTGLATSDVSGAKFEKFARTPILDRTNDEPFIRSTCSVLNIKGALRMWYVSSLKWTTDEHGIHYICIIRHATSNDGIAWNTSDEISLQPKLPDEYAVGRPSVVYDGQLFRMWYSIRSFSQLYAIGYAESEDGLTWVRKDNEVELTKSESGWDSEMVCYPFILDLHGTRLMFYNGNRRGATGFGFAVLEN